MKFQSAGDIAALRAAQVRVQIPSWAYGGNPAGLAGMAGWALERDESGWLVQNAESVKGRPPRLIRILDAGSESSPDDESTYASLRELSDFDGILTTNLWERAVAFRAELVEKYPHDAAAMLTGAMALIGATPTAGELPAVAAAVMPELHRNALPNARMFLVRGSTELAGRLQMPGVFLRVSDDAPKPSSGDLHFQSAHHLMPDNMVGLGPFLAPVFSSLSPHVWGINIPRIGGSIAIVFGESLPGRRSFAVDLLDTASPMGNETRADPVGAIERSAFREALRWWASRLDLLLSHATEPAVNSRDGQWEPGRAQQRIITLTQVFRSCQALATSSDDHTRRVLMFNVLDQLPGLNPQWNWSALTKPKAAVERLDKIRLRMPASVQTVLLPRAERAIEGLRAVAEGFFAAELLDGDGIRLPDKAGGNVTVPRVDAASEWLRVLRNSTHGFDQGLTPRQGLLLEAHNGRVPATVADLAWLHLVYLMAYPELLGGTAAVLARRRADTSA
ncbi:hypothetical protein SAMN06295974_1350 [Plantibacter flavus]|uniref:Uncharacterized protein n=1 Tax=Plantibacter flavus TaxID=150123 RepID=A0A3N2C6Y8_9MICO|nr:hypothetical protein [Plantibacter flavus]ROR83283.1 hypothetical protein EDD42_3394 [Plantibacter flavus]SMG22200.1 hypothetical protein SAMN06295974_1350 [Plantibacter flavus]